ncbi:DNA-binding GntR family transcriptional regulator [Knoellia remsis]|uniref:DNA-binding GntR family transcriptional regulator n=1 Tax=Knoellia remsis TaxID=407159 RepID=A0A2T0U4L9_9MICO|nr:GntR family transcriptional regulator [Knoellia remsis]PRY52877.1 DNA-binding GntR family transcriptional regulator [Knoellia remsis]
MPDTPLDPSPDLSIPTRAVLADDVFDALKDALVTRRIEPGARMNIDALARQLHVSNTPVRQALGRLEALGLVVKVPYRGFLASQLLDSRTIAELYDFRLILEPTLAARAALRHSPEGADRLESVCDIDALADLAGRPDAGRLLGARDIEFHRGVATEAGNSAIVDQLTAALDRMMRYTLYDRQTAADLAWNEHRAVLHAIRRRDAEGAADAMRQHLHNGLDRMRDAIR